MSKSLQTKVLALEQQTSEQVKEQLPLIVKKIELMLTTLGQFQKTAR